MQAQCLQYVPYHKSSQSWTLHTIGVINSEGFVDLAEHLNNNNNNNNNNEFKVRFGVRRRHRGHHEYLCL